MEQKMKANLLSLNILTHELYGRNYPLYGNQTADDYCFEKRLKYFLGLLDYTKPDVVMLQELSGPKYWGTVLDLEPIDETKAVYTSKKFPNFAWVNHGNRYGTLYADNQTKRNPFDAHNLVMFNTQKFDLIASGTYWLTVDGKRESTWMLNEEPYRTTPDDIGDCTWLVLKDKETGIQAVYVSTHSYVGSVQRNAYHIENLTSLTQGIGKIAEQYGTNGKALPIIIAGDFNISPARRNVEHSYEHMVKYAKFDDAKMVAAVSDESGTARVFGCDMGGHDGTDGNGERIDFFFSQGMDVPYYHVLKGMMKPTEENGNVYTYVEPAVFDGSMFDISDHLPIYAKVEIGTGEKYASHRVDPDAHYVNPNTANDKIFAERTPTMSTGRHLKFDSNRVAQFVGSMKGDMQIDLVEDAEKGFAIRLMAKKHTNEVNVDVRYNEILKRSDAAEEDRVFISGANKLILTYKVDLSLLDVDLRFIAVAGNRNDYAQYQTTRLNTNTAGWQTMEIDISRLQGEIGFYRIYGAYNNTGLLKGDAIYIASVELQ